MPKTIYNAVGVGGANLPIDVRVVQYLLNCVPAMEGGPKRELAVDGLIGPLTVEAIRRFQATFTAAVDGRVDPGGKTMARLTPYDPFPSQQLPDTTAKSAAGKGDGDPWGGGGKDAGGSKSSGGGAAGVAAGKFSGAEGAAKGGGFDPSDPYGFYNPASPYYMKAGYAPGGAAAAGVKTAKSAGEEAAGGGSKSADAGSKSAGDAWGFFNPASPYYMKAGYAPGSAAKSGGGGAAGGKTAGS